MLKQVGWMSGPAMRSDMVRGRSDHEALLWDQRDRDHVARQALSIAHSRIETTLHHIDQGILGRDLDLQAAGGRAGNGRSMAR